MVQYWNGQKNDQVDVIVNGLLRSEKELYKADQDGKMRPIQFTEGRISTSLGRYISDRSAVYPELMGDYQPSARSKPITSRVTLEKLMPNKKVFITAILAFISEKYEKSKMMNKWKFVPEADLIQTAPTVETPAEKKAREEREERARNRSAVKKKGEDGEPPSPDYSQPSSPGVPSDEEDDTKWGDGSSGWKFLKYGHIYDQLAGKKLQIKRSELSTAKKDLGD